MLMWSENNCSLRYQNDCRLAQGLAQSFGEFKINIHIKTHSLARVVLTRHLLRLPINCLVCLDVFLLRSLLHFYHIIPTTYLDSIVGDHGGGCGWGRGEVTWTLLCGHSVAVWNKARSHSLQVLTFYHCIIWNNTRYISCISGHRVTATAGRCWQNKSTIHGDWSHQGGQEDIVPLRTAHSHCRHGWYRV